MVGWLPIKNYTKLFGIENIFRMMEILWHTYPDSPEDRKRYKKTGIYTECVWCRIPLWGISSIGLLEYCSKMVDKWMALAYPSITFRISIHTKLYEYILTATICCVTIKMKFVFVFIKRWIVYFGFGKVRK